MCCKYDNIQFGNINCRIVSGSLGLEEAGDLAQPAEELLLLGSQLLPGGTTLCYVNSLTANDQFE